MKYTIGHQDFRRIREEGRAYVDKTEHVCRLIDDGGYLFLSRPRRFGKSLTVATMNELYSGDAALFEGLWAGEHWDFEAKRRPVIWLKFASAGYQTGGLRAALLRMLREQADAHGVDLGGGDNVAVCFGDLIERVAATNARDRVVILIDEYDKPILEYLSDTGKAEANRDILKGFYGVLKDLNPYLELVFITGVSAFSKVSLFSDLNNLTNLTLDRRAYTLVGLTQAELEANFAEQLDESGHTRDEIRNLYNGYAWGDHDRVYNPWSILKFLESGQLRNFWSGSGTPTFVTRLMANGGYYDIAPVEVDETQLTSFNLARLDPVAILFQAGYLTVKHVPADDFLYVLDYPNEEVRRTFQTALLGEYGFSDLEGPVPRVLRLKKAFAARDLETVVDIIDASLAAVPYQLWQAKSEAMVHAIVHTTFTVLGMYTRSEVSTSRGRADIVVEVPGYVYVMELKIGGTAAEALAQIEERGYAEAYVGGVAEVIKVGMAFDLEVRRVREWLEA